MVSIQACILESALTLVHPYSKNKSDKEDCLFFIHVLFHIILGNICEINMPSPIVTSPHNIELFRQQKQHAKKKRKKREQMNQVCEVRVIPGLKIFHFREYEPRLSLYAAFHTDLELLSAD